MTLRLLDDTTVTAPSDADSDGRRNDVNETGAAFGDPRYIRSVKISIELVSHRHGPAPVIDAQHGRAQARNLHDVPRRERSEISGLRATVNRIDEEGRPKVVHYEFDRNLDGSDVAWFSEGGSGFSDVRPPPVGFGVRLAP